MLTRRRFLHFSGGALGALVLGCVSQPPDTSATGASIALRYPKWTTHCVGRHLVDMPESSTHTWICLIYRKPFIKLNVTPEQARKLASDKIAELKNTAHKTKGNMFIRSIELPADGILIQGWDFPKSIDTSSVYIYTSVKTSAGTAFYYYENDLSQDREKSALRRYVEIASKLRAVEPGEIPTAPGYCMGEIMLLDSEETWIEEAAIGVDLPDAPGVRLAFETSLPLDDYSTLLENDIFYKRKCDSLRGVKRCRTIRRAKRDVGPIHAEELCLAGDDPNAHYRKYGFTWYTPGKLHNRSEPCLEAGLLYYSSSPHSARPFSTDKDALALWDRMINSIRVRPVVKT